MPVIVTVIRSMSNTKYTYTRPTGVVGAGSHLPLHLRVVCVYFVLLLLIRVCACNSNSNSISNTSTRTYPQMSWELQPPSSSTGGLCAVLCVLFTDYVLLPVHSTTVI